MNIVTKHKPEDVIKLMNDLIGSIEWQELCQIIQENDISKLKKQTDSELFGNLDMIDPERMARIASLRYRVNALEEFIGMPQKIIDGVKLGTIGQTEAQLDETNRVY